MNRIAVLEIFGEFDYVTYYTIRLVENGVENDLSETDKFYETYDDPEHTHYSEFDVLQRVIDAMGCSENGAEACLFRFEDAAHALPPKRGEAKRVLDIEIVLDSVLRLYCLRLTNEVVLLLNGGVKTEDQALDCPNVKVHFKTAQVVAKAIDELIRDRSIRIKDKEIINETGEDEIIIDLN